MITFTIALLALIAGYFIYGRFISRIFGPDDRPTPAVAMADGVDYIVLPPWKLFMIQFLNIAGLGPIFGAIMGAQFGTGAYLWIVLGTIFGGAVHDFFVGGISMRNKGESLPQIVGRFLGTGMQRVMCVFTIVLLILVAAVWVSGPADILGRLTDGYVSVMAWIVIIFLYYVLATMLPIDKIIGKIYPVFAATLLFMAVGIMVVLYVKCPDLPEMWNGFGTKYDSAPIFPMLFISIACGAISGFHATQSPLMARCIGNEKLARPVFYGAMVTEGIVALVWAAAATVFYHDNGIIGADGKAFSAAAVAFGISNEWLGVIGGTIATLGIVVASISSGDTALRSARLVVADFFKIGQHSVTRRLMVSAPIFLITLLVLVYSLSDADGFKIIWRYFAWCNQTLAVFALWAITVYLARERKLYWVTLLPALFMTAVCSTYIVMAPEGFGLPATVGYPVGAVAVATTAILFIRWIRSLSRVTTL